MQVEKKTHELRLSGMLHKQYLLAYLFAGVIACMYGCGSSTEKVPVPQTVQQLQQQLAASCAAVSGVYVKSVQDLATPGATVEVQRLGDWKIPEGDTMVCRLKGELRYALEPFYQNPYIRSYFTEQINGDTLIAILKPGKESGTDLRVQKIVFAPVDSQLLYIESQVRKEHWLFDVRTHIRIFFDPQGNYQTHTLEIWERTTFLKRPFHVLIEGRVER